MWGGGGRGRGHHHRYGVVGYGVRLRRINHLEEAGSVERIVTTTVAAAEAAVADATVTAVLVGPASKSWIARIQRLDWAAITKTGAEAVGKARWRVGAS